jgi:hypothetical protein
VEFSCDFPRGELCLSKGPLHMSKKSTFCERYARAVADADVVEQATNDERQRILL